MNTKHISLLGLGLLAAVALGSCDKIEESTSKPITNPQEPIFDNLSVELIAFPYINASDPEAGDVKVAYCVTNEMPAGYTFTGTLQLSTSEDFAKTITVPLTYSDSYLYANIGDIAAQYTDAFSKSPATVDLFGRTDLSITNGSDTAHVGPLGYYFAAGPYIYTPVPASKLISSTYFIVPGNGTEWDYYHAQEFSHSATNQYDDPNFSVVVNRKSDMGDKWIVLPGETYWDIRSGEAELMGSQYYLPIFDRTESGTSYGDLEDSHNINSTALPSLAIPCEISINARDMTYTSKAAIEHYYATGSGWANWGAHWMPLYTTDYQNYDGFLNLGDEFKFAPQAGWGDDFGAAKALAPAADQPGVYTGTVKDSGDNIKGQPAGLYWTNLNVSDWSLTLTAINSWGLIGDFNGWGGDVAMTPSADLYTWTGEITVSAGQGWKFRANGEWKFDLGGTDDNLTKGGANIVLPEAGTYTITLDLTTYPSTFTAVKK